MLRLHIRRTDPRALMFSSVPHQKKRNKHIKHKHISKNVKQFFVAKGCTYSVWFRLYSDTASEVETLKGKDDYSFFSLNPRVRTAAAARERRTGRRCPSLAPTQLFVPPNTIFFPLFHLISGAEHLIPLHPGQPPIIYFCFCLRRVFPKGHRAIVRDGVVAAVEVCTDSYQCVCVCVCVKLCATLIAFVCSCACAASVFVLL